MPNYLANRRWWRRGGNLGYDDLIGNRRILELSIKYY